MKKGTKNALSPVEELDQFIDSLNKERKPQISEDEETANLQEMARMVRTLRPINEPSEEFTSNLEANLTTHFKTTQFKQKGSKPISSKPPIKSKGKSKKLMPWIGLAASILVMVFLISTWANGPGDIVSAMEQTIKQLDSYHGVLEKRMTNEDGETNLIQQNEIWFDKGKYAMLTKEGVITVNNGDILWEKDPSTKTIRILPIYLDPQDFDLKEEAAKALEYPHQIVGEDLVAGRTATRLEITPPGGLPYYLWIDQETNLPVQLQTAMQKSLHTTYTYTSLETNIPIPPTTFAYNPTEDYQVIDENPDKLVANLDEAINVSGLIPIKPTSENPKRLFASPNRIVFDYEDTIIIETKATDPLILSPLASLGRAGDGQLEVLEDSLRWQEKGLEIQIQGQRSHHFANEIATNLAIPEEDQSFPQEPMVKVNIDMEVVKNNQQQVDSGSSPWQLDPVQVAFTFASLQISPEGIMGEPPLDYNSLNLTINTGTVAVVEVSEGPIKTIYLKRLIRQDESGIWTVVGYDKR